MLGTCSRRTLKFGPSVCSRWRTLSVVPWAPTTSSVWHPEQRWENSSAPRWTFACWDLIAGEMPSDPHATAPPAAAISTTMARRRRMTARIIRKAHGCVGRPAPTRLPRFPDDRGVNRRTVQGRRRARASGSAWRGGILHRGERPAETQQRLAVAGLAVGDGADADRVVAAGQQFAQVAGQPGQRAVEHRDPVGDGVGDLAELLAR